MTEAGGAKAPRTKKARKKKPDAAPLVIEPSAPVAAATTARAQPRKLQPEPGADDAAYVDAKKWVGGAAILLLAGVALVATADITLGPWLTVAGMAVAIVGAHKLGRSGPEGSRAPSQP